MIVVSQDKFHCIAPVHTPSTNPFCEVYQLGSNHLINIKQLRLRFGLSPIGVILLAKNLTKFKPAIKYTGIQ